MQSCKSYSLIFCICLFAIIADFAQATPNPFSPEDSAFVVDPQAFPTANPRPTVQPECLPPPVSGNYHLAFKDWLISKTPMAREMNRLAPLASSRIFTVGTWAAMFEYARVQGIVQSYVNLSESEIVSLIGVSQTELGRLRSEWQAEVIRLSQNDNFFNKTMPICYNVEAFKNVAWTDNYISFADMIAVSSTYTASSNFWYNLLNGGIPTIKRIVISWRTINGDLITDVSPYNWGAYGSDDFGFTRTCHDTRVVCGYVRTPHGGCFVPETMLTLADGRKKAAKDLIAGELLLNPLTGKGSRIASIVEGRELPALVEFGYEDRNVQVTQTHPVQTREGLKQAISLNTNDEILGEDLQYHRVTNLSILPIKEAQTVINFILEAGADEKEHFVLSNGIITGDLYLQLKLAAELQ